jgi:hypothetical protein
MTKPDGKVLTTTDLCAELQLIVNLAKQHADDFMQAYVEERLNEAKKHHLQVTGVEWK